MSKPYSSVLLFIFVSTIVLQSSNVQSWFFKSAGQNAANALGSSVSQASANLQQSLNHASNKLSQAINTGVKETAAVVRELAGSIEEMAKSVSVRIDSGDLAHIGADATKNIQEALVQLSENWNVAINTADLKSVGADAAMYLSKALKNVKIKLEFYFSVDDNIVKAVLYISIAVGVGFSVCCVAIVISLKQCRSCTMSLFVTCVEGCRSCRNSNDNSNNLGRSGRTEPVLNPEEEMNVFIDKNLDKNNSTATAYKQINVNDRACKTKSFAGFNDFKKVKKFWQNQPGHISEEKELEVFNNKF